MVKKIQTKISVNKHLKYPNLIHPNVVGDWERIKIGIGNVICASNTLTTNIVFGDFNIVNLDCTIGHDVVIGNYNVII